MLNFDKIRKKNICLVGMMGSGKSIIGKELSKYFKIQILIVILKLRKMLEKA